MQLSCSSFNLFERGLALSEEKPGNADQPDPDHHQVHGILGRRSELIDQEVDQDRRDLLGNLLHGHHDACIS